MKTRSPSGPLSRGSLTYYLHLYILCSFAFSKPLFDVLSESAPFFAVRISPALSVLLVVLILTFFLPAFLVLLEVVAGLAGPRAEKTVHGAFVTVLIFFITLPIANGLDFSRARFSIALAGTIASLLCFAYLRYRPLRMAVTYAVPAVVIFPALFLFDPAVAAIAFPGFEDTSSNKPTFADFAGRSQGDVPVIVILFDEFDVASLMNESHEIDGDMYPNFASLAKKSHWFRNATTVSDSTVFSVPAIISGRYPRTEHYPTSRDFPENLFTILEGYGAFHVHEPLHFCPPKTCKEQYGFPFAYQLLSLVSDASIIYAHIVTPETLKSSLPVIANDWRDYYKGLDKLVAEVVSALPPLKPYLEPKQWPKSRDELFRWFIHNIPIGPSLSFLHIYLPHSPYQFLPSGKDYGEVPALGFLSAKQWRWIDDEWTTIHAWQRYLLQVAFVDKLIGEFVEILEKKGVFDKALIVITADHGVSFKAGNTRRYLSHENYMDILPVPLFIKLPHQKEGFISDRNIETVDIFPTIAQVLGLKLTGPTEGFSVFDESAIEKRGRKSGYSHQFAGGDVTSKPPKLYPYPAQLDEKYKTVEKQIRIFGTGQGPEKLFSIGPYTSFVGKSVRALPLQDDLIAGTVVLDNAKPILMAGEAPPDYLVGKVKLSGSSGVWPYHLALAINGVVRSVSHSISSDPDGSGHFGFILPEAAYPEGAKKLEFFLISPLGSGPPEGIALARLTVE